MELKLPHIPLTEEEEIFYANYSLVELCDGTCHDYCPMFMDDKKNYIIYDGKFICLKCRN
jgi:hypothetical protein